MQNVQNLFKQAGVKFSDKVGEYELNLDHTLYPQELKAFVKAGALDEKSLYELFTTDTGIVTIDFNKIPERWFKRLSDSYIKSLLEGNFSICNFEEGYQNPLTELGITRKGITLQTTVCVEKE